jgi:NAD(P)-dependent dehydrogenase (short-subunit alcohol dehydrogenase family)
MQHILITGANRGIGLELTRQYLQTADVFVFATCRQPENATDLIKLVRVYPERLTILPLDVTNTEQSQTVVQTIQQRTNKIDTLINNAGINPTDKNLRRLGELDGAAIQAVIYTNAIAPLLFTQACVELLKNGTNPRVIMVSSQMGSLDWTKSGGSYAYRISKAAMNMAARTLAMDLGAHNITTITLHPGWVQTDMGGSGADIPTQESAAGIIQVIQKLTPADNGTFLKWNGEDHAW